MRNYQLLVICSVSACEWQARGWLKERATLAARGAGIVLSTHKLSCSSRHCTMVYKWQCGNPSYRDYNLGE